MIFKKKYNDLVALIPIYNESKNILKIIHNLSSYCDVLIVDDCSTDQSKYICRLYADIYLRNKKQLGYDKTLRKGYSFITENLNKKYIIVLDGDGQHKISDALRLYKNTKHEKANLGLGVRDNKNRVIEKIISYFSKIILKISDPYSGLKCVEIDKIKNIKKKMPKFDTIGLFFILEKKNLKIHEIKISINPKNKLSSFGEGMWASLFLLITFIKVIFYIKVK